MYNNLKYIAVLFCLVGFTSCLKEDKCASKTLCIINQSGSDQQVSISGDYSGSVTITDGGEECVDLDSDVDDIELDWTSSDASFILDQCFTEYTIQ